MFEKYNNIEILANTNFLIECLDKTLYILVIITITLKQLIPPFIKKRIHFSIDTTQFVT